MILKHRFFLSHFIIKIIYIFDLSDNLNYSLCYCDIKFFNNFSIALFSDNLYDKNINLQHFIFDNTLNLDIQKFLSIWINKNFTLFYLNWNYSNPIIYKFVNFFEFYEFLTKNNLFLFSVISYKNLNNNKFFINLYVLPFSNFYISNLNLNLPIYYF